MRVAFVESRKIYRITNSADYVIFWMYLPRLICRQIELTETMREEEIMLHESKRKAEAQMLINIETLRPVEHSYES